MSLARSRYGKSRVRLVRVDRRADCQDLKDLTVQIQVEGDFAAAHVDGDNRNVTATDTMKNTVYALARGGTGEIEEFGQKLVAHFLHLNPANSHVQVTVEEALWERIPVDGKPHGSAFVRQECGTRVATVSGTRETMQVTAGVDGLLVLKTADTAFEGFRNDTFRTLKDARDRIVATMMHATWLYSRTGLAYKILWNGVRGRILETFAQHDSKSVQHTIHAMGEAVLAEFGVVAEISFSLPNKHHLLADLSPFGMTNENEIFVATDEPFGLIEATIRR
jgi:urate oxidase